MIAARIARDDDMAGSQILDRAAAPRLAVREPYLMAWYACRFPRSPDLVRAAVAQRPRDGHIGKGSSKVIQPEVGRPP